MKRHEIDRLAGQTPCLCGSIETWHFACYKGKTQQEVDSAIPGAYRIAARKLRERAAAQATRAISRIMGEEKA
jgi:hypothetical protein